MNEVSTGVDQRQLPIRRSLIGSLEDDFRPDVEGLRAVAVLVVLLFHAGVAGFTGGFIGVDVFFVLSGFLITRLLLKELATEGSISLGRFWARRARRLLPASALVVVVTVFTARFVLAPLEQRSLALDTVAVGAFVVNYRFAAQFGDYFGAQLGALSPSPLLHFWSLAVEEQFYLFWPALMIVVGRRPRQYRRLLAMVIGTIGIASLVLSVWLTSTNPTWAFYLLPARMCELIAGALVALLGSSRRLVPVRVRVAAGWVGLAVIAFATVRFDASVPFPGVAVLVPVLATVLVLLAGGSRSERFSPSFLLEHPVMQWVGRHSYAIYLWHWPALVLAEAKWGPLSTPQRVAVVAGSVGIAALSFHFLEDPVRRSTRLTVHPSRGLALGGALCAAVLITGALAWYTLPTLDGGTVAAAPTLVPTQATTAPTTPSAGTGDQPTATGLPTLEMDDLDSLIAANQQVLAQGLLVEDVPSNLKPSLEDAFDDKAQLYPDDCVNIGVDADVHDCRYGRSGGTPMIVLYGDSHAAHWFPALEAIAQGRGAELVVFTKGGCPTADVPIPTATLGRTCPQWRDDVIDRIAELQPDMVVVSAASDYPNSDDEWGAGLERTLARIGANTQDLVVLGDNPHAADVAATCLSDHLNSASACVNRRVRAVEPGRIEAEERAADTEGGRFIDTSDWLCTPEACPVIIGDILLYRDSNHLSTTGAGWLRPLLEAALFPG